MDCSDKGFPLDRLIVKHWRRANALAAFFIHTSKPVAQGVNEKGKER